MSLLNSSTCKSNLNVRVTIPYSANMWLDIVHCIFCLVPSRAVAMGRRMFQNIVLFVC